MAGYDKTHLSLGDPELWPHKHARTAKKWVKNYSSKFIHMCLCSKYCIKMALGCARTSLFHVLIAGTNNCPPSTARSHGRRPPSTAQSHYTPPRPKKWDLRTGGGGGGGGGYRPNPQGTGCGATGAARKRGTSGGPTVGTYMYALSP